MEIKKSYKLTRQKWLNLFDVEYNDKNGRTKSWQLASRQRERASLVEARVPLPDQHELVDFLQK